jgi:hypothetical protein
VIGFHAKRGALAVYRVFQWGGDVGENLGGAAVFAIDPMKHAVCNRA